MSRKIFQELTENVVRRDLKKENSALVEKWRKYGLLEGLSNPRQVETMAVLLENQAKQLLREASAMQTGDVEGFAAVAFPIVRRVFGELIANDLVSIQPMSMPSGLIFFLDFTYTDTKLNAGAVAAKSLYGGNKVGSQITGGIDLSAAGRDSTNHLWYAEQGFYNLNNGYSSPTGSVTASLNLLAVRSGSGTWVAGTTGDSNYVRLGESLINADPDLTGSVVGVYRIGKTTLTNLNSNNLVAIHTTASISSSVAGTAAYTMVRRLTKLDPLAAGQILVVFATPALNPSSAEVDSADALEGKTETFTYPVVEGFTTSNALGSVVGTTPWGLEGTAELAGQTGLNLDIPEIDIKVDSVAVTTVTKKLKAKWSQELAQDLSAYHSLDAEVELTSILSEQIGLEIDQEILLDLIKGATAGTYFWSRNPGKFVDKATGADLTSNGASLPDFTGNVSMWYETLLETVNDVSAVIHRKTLRGGANFLVTSPEVCSILEMTAGFRASVTVDSETGTAGAVNVGSVSKKWDVYCDPYFPRNVILVGRKGSTWLETGYVYAPYVALQTTPTIFGTSDFVPRKGVMTRYAKKMIQSDFYGLVVVTDLLG